MPDNVTDRAEVLRLASLIGDRTNNGEIDALIEAALTVEGTPRTFEFTREYGDRATRIYPNYMLLAQLLKAMREKEIADVHR